MTLTSFKPICEQRALIIPCVLISVVLAKVCHFLVLQFSVVAIFFTETCG